MKSDLEVHIRLLKSELEQALQIQDTREAYKLAFAIERAEISLSESNPGE